MSCDFCRLRFERFRQRMRRTDVGVKVVPDGSGGFKAVRTCQRTGNILDDIPGLTFSAMPDKCTCGEEEE